jgi:uncharacterized cupredoxin-like copper-binding protein
MGNTQRLGSSVRSALAAAAFTASMGLMAVTAPVATAQDATPAPMAECVAPELPPGTPTPMDMASPEAMPPMMMEEASPEAEAEVVGAPADEATAAAAVAAAQNLAACVNSGNYAGAAALLTDNAVMEITGTGNPYDVVAGFEEEGFAFANFTTGAVYAYEDGSVSVDVQYNESQYQVTGERWYLVQDGEYWKLDRFEPVTPIVDGDTAVVGVSLTDYAFTFNVSSVVQPEVLMFQVRNDGTEPHELVLFRMPEGAETAEDVAAMLEEDPEGSFMGEDSFIGATFAMPGEQSNLTLVGLEPGLYVAICFIPGPDGEPHYAHGMIAGFEVLGL